MKYGAIQHHMCFNVWSCCCCSGLFHHVLPNAASCSSPGPVARGHGTQRFVSVDFLFIYFFFLFAHFSDVFLWQVQRRVESSVSLPESHMQFYHCCFLINSYMLMANSHVGNVLTGSNPALSHCPSTSFTN